ncbi:phosphate acetyltransferase [Buchnera aphidicola]|uniref:Phosphate acetyltransferase n=1 Tax=Buchnera aphidicola (Aphis aurantii) TaxID=1470492 RepID=A0AAU6W548_9GAMM
MSRIIMLVPLNENINLTTITSSLIYLISKRKKNIFGKSCFYFSLISNLMDKTRLVMKKYFFKNIISLENIDFSKQYFNSKKYHMLVNQVIEQCYHQKDSDGLILIQGINKNQHVYADQINYEVSQNINAEVIFIEYLKAWSVENINEKEHQIKIFLKFYKYKNIAGFIFDNLNSPFIQKKYNFIEKLNILYSYKKNKNILKIEKDIFLKNMCFPVLTCIPWNRNLFRPSVIEICNFLNANIIDVKNIKNFFIKKIIIFNQNNNNIKNCNYSLFLVCFSYLEVFFYEFFIKSKKNKIIGIILTGISKFTKNILYFIKCLKNKNIPILYINTDIITTLSKLQKFNCDINYYNKTYLNKIFKYISSHFQDINFNTFTNKTINNKKYSPKKFCFYLKILSKKNIKRIILPEAYEPRILKAAEISNDLGIAECILLGNEKKIFQIASDKGINLSKNIKIIEPNLIRENYISRLIELRKHKGMTEFSAVSQLQDNTVLATLILEANKVDGLVSGSINTTANTIRPALQIIKTNPVYSLVSSIFFMLFPQEVLIYGDCAINVDPTAEELAEIAIQSANSAKIFGIEPRIAMLSYSSGHSGIGFQVEKVRNATAIVRLKQPNLIIEGPIQYDAAISRHISQLKLPNSSISGSANIFIFPDLNSGNITYKAVQRSMDLICIGPMLQGLRKPVNDLSRGASIDDIVYTIALTAIQS